MRSTTLLERRDLVEVVRPVHPVASVYLAPEPGVSWADRLGGLVDGLRAGGAGEATIHDVVAALPDGPPTAVALFADGGHVPALFATPGRRGPDVVRCAGPAHVLPLLAWQQERPPCVLVDVKRTDVIVSVLPGRSEVSAEPLRCKRKAVVDVCRQVVERTGVRLVVVSGDSRLAERIKAASAPHITVRPVRDLSDGRLAEVARTTAGLWVSQSMADLAERTRTPRHATQGSAATLDALACRRARELLVTSPPDDDTTAWYGRGSTQVRLADGTPPPKWAAQRGPAADVAVRSALLDGIPIRVPRPGTPGAPAAGIGALCRFPLTVVAR